MTEHFSTKITHEKANLLARMFDLNFTKMSNRMS